MVTNIVSSRSASSISIKAQGIADVYVDLVVAFSTFKFHLINNAVTTNDRYQQHQCRQDEGIRNLSGRLNDNREAALPKMTTIAMIVSRYYGT